MKRVRAQLAYANVVSTLALFLAVPAQGSASNVFVC